MLDDTVMVAFAGDWHGNGGYAARALAYAAGQGADVVLHVGDFGIFPPYRFLNHVETHAARLGLTVLFVDGNHEHHDWLNAQKVDNDGVRRLTEHVWHLPRGYRWEWFGVTFLALGGAHSVDRSHRRANVDWFPNEVISIADAYRAVEAGPVDVMVTHDAPDQVHLPIGDGSWIPEEDLYLAQVHRQLLGQVVDEVNPKHLFHGHYHVNYDGERVNKNGDKTLVHGLDLDGTPFDRNMRIVNIFDLQFID